MTHRFPNLVSALQIRLMTFCTTCHLEIMPSVSEENKNISDHSQFFLDYRLSLKVSSVDTVKRMLNRTD